MAFVHAIGPIRHSYSQAGEDQLVEQFLGNQIPKDEIYVDVGANHPTQLSNTYRFFRRGYRGIVIEPNRLLLRMHRLVRSGDSRMAIGCGAIPSVLEFHYANSHVLSGFSTPRITSASILGGELMPVLPLDVVLQGVSNQPVFLLSIDVEGFDLEVARGAIDCLARTRAVIIEGQTTDIALMDFFRNQGFKMVAETDHNLVFARTDCR